MKSFGDDSSTNRRGSVFQAVAGLRRRGSDVSTPPSSSKGVFRCLRRKAKDQPEPSSTEKVSSTATPSAACVEPTSSPASPKAPLPRDSGGPVTPGGPMTPSPLPRESTVSTGEVLVEIERRRPRFGTDMTSAPLPGPTSGTTTPDDGDHNIASPERLSRRDRADSEVYSFISDDSNELKRTGGKPGDRLSAASLAGPHGRTPATPDSGKPSMAPTLASLQEQGFAPYPHERRDMTMPTIYSDSSCLDPRLEELLTAVSGMEERLKHILQSVDNLVTIGMHVSSTGSHCTQGSRVIDAALSSRLARCLPATARARDRDELEGPLLPMEFGRGLSSAEGTPGKGLCWCSSG